MNWCGGMLLCGLALGAPAAARAIIYNTAFPIEGTAVNATNVIGAGSSLGVGFDKTNGLQAFLVPTSSTIDAGQYSDGITMYLNNSGTLNCVRNNDGFNTGSYNIGDAFGVSGVVEVGGARYCVLAGTDSGVQLLALATGVQTPLGSATNYNFTGAQGLDAFMRPGGTTINDMAVGISTRLGPGFQFLDIYTAAGEWLDTINPTSSFGNINDVSFDLANNKIWFGTRLSNTAGRVFDEAFDFSAYAVGVPSVSVTVTNGAVAVRWSGRELEACGGDLTWAVVATAPATPTQLLAPPPYTEPATNSVRLFRARW